MTENWPSKLEREEFEINGFIRSYEKLPTGRQFVVMSKSEKPDYYVKDSTTDDVFGIELTSVYLHDRSVPDMHMPRQEGAEDIPCDSAEFSAYLRRLVDSVKEKIAKAKKGYDVEKPLILAIYVNEYISSYIEEKHLKKMIDDNRSVFDNMFPFSEIVFWDLPNDDIFSVRPQ